MRFTGRFHQGMFQVCYGFCLVTTHVLAPSQEFQSSSVPVWDNEGFCKVWAGKGRTCCFVLVSKYTPWLQCTSHFNCPNIDHPMEECNGSPLVISVKRVRGRAGHKASALMVMMLLFIDPHFISCRVSGKRFSLGEMDTWSSFSSWCTLRQKREQPSG